MRLHRSLFFLVAVVGSVFGQNLKPVGDRLAAQNALFEAQYESDLRHFPERATAFGDYRYNDKLSEHSLDAIAHSWLGLHLPKENVRKSGLQVEVAVGTVSQTPSRSE